MTNFIKLLIEHLFMAAQKSSLSPKAFIIIGIAISVASLAMNMSREYQRFTLFVVAGVVVFLYGLFKQFTQKGEKEMQKMRNMHNQILHPNQHMHHNRQHKPVMQTQQLPKKKFCPFCATHLHPHARYCSNCGNQVN